MPVELQRLIGYNDGVGSMGKADGRTPAELVQQNYSTVNQGAAPDPWRHGPRPMPHREAGPNGEPVGRHDASGPVTRRQRAAVAVPAKSAAKM